MLAAVRYDSVASTPYVSTDSGATWSAAGTSFAAGQVFLYCASSGLFLMNQFSNGVVFSSDDMVTRTSRSGSGHYLVGCAGATVIAAPSSFSGNFTMRRSADGGVNWATITTSVPAPSFGTVFGSGNGSGIWIANTPGAALRSTDDGLTWAALASPDSGLSMRRSLWTGTEFLWALSGSSSSKLFASADGSAWTLRQEISGSFAGLFPAAPIGT